MADIGQALQGGLSGAGSGASLGTSILPGWGTAIGAGAGALMGALPALLGDESEEANKKRLAQLKSMMENNTLGLTEQEKNALYDSLLSRNQAQIDKMTADRNRQLSSAVSMGAGQGFDSMAGEEEAVARSRSEVDKIVELKDLERQKLMEDEYYARAAAVGERTKQRQGTVAGLGTDLLGAGMNMAEDNLLKGGPAVNQNRISGLASKYGIGEDVVTKLLGSVGQNPDLAQYLTMLGGA